MVSNQQFVFRDTWAMHVTKWWQVVASRQWVGKHSTSDFPRGRRSLLGYLVVSAHLYDIGSYTFNLRLQCDFSKCLTKTLHGSMPLQTISVLWPSGCGYNLKTLEMLSYSKIIRQEYILSICYFFFNLFNITNIFYANFIFVAVN